MLLIDDAQRVDLGKQAIWEPVGASGHSVLGETIRDLARRYPTHESFRVLAEPVPGGSEVRRDHQRRHSDGRIRCLRTNFDPVRDGRGQVMHYLVSLRDVTEERARQRSLQRLSSAVRMSSEGIAITDAEGVLRSGQRGIRGTAWLLVGARSQGTSWSASLAPGVPEGFAAELERALARHGDLDG